MIHRCEDWSCRRLIWPWQRRGWIFITDTERVWKHGSCEWPVHGWWMGV